MSELLPEISPENRGIKGDSKPKAKFLKDVYDVSIIGGDARDALWKKVMPGSEKPKRPHHPADDKAAQWMREERARAEERAEKKWRNKFKEWQEENKGSPGANKHRLAKREKSPEKSDKEGAAAQPESSVQVRPSDEELESLRQENEGLREQVDKLGSVYEEFRKAGQELKQEKERTRALQRHVSTVVQERDSWRGRAAQRESQLKKAAAIRQTLAMSIEKLSRRLERFDSGLSQSVADDEGETTSGQEQPQAALSHTSPAQPAQASHAADEYEVAKALLQDANDKDEYADEDANDKDEYADEDANDKDEYADEDANDKDEYADEDEGDAEGEEDEEARHPAGYDDYADDDADEETYED